MNPLNNYVCERLYSREFGEALVNKYNYSEDSIKKGANMKSVLLSILLFSVVAIAAPNSPSHLSLVPSSTTVDISWQDNSNDETGFKIFRDGHLIHTTQANQTHFKDIGLQADTTYRYTIKATDDANGLEYSDKHLIMHGRFKSDEHVTFYIDADNNPNTGYNGKHSEIKGADYLIQDGDSAVYKYPANATGWKWDKVGTAHFQKTSTQASTDMPENLIHLGSSFKFVGSVSSSDWKSTTYSDYAEVKDSAEIGSNKLKIMFSKSESGIELDAITSQDSALLHDSISLFDLEVSKITDTMHPYHVKADSGWQTSSITQNENSVTLRWSHPIDTNLPSSLNVIATVLVDNGIAKWDLKVTGLDTQHTLMDTIFPQFDIQAAGDDHLFVPYKFGKVVDNPASHDIGFTNLQYPRGWRATMQFMAYYNNHYGLYFGIHDPQANIKKLSATQQNGAVHIAVSVPAPNKTRAGNNWEFPGEFEIDIFNGDWYDAAMIYKRWVYAKADYKPSQTLRQSAKNLKNIDIWGDRNVYEDSKNRSDSWLADNIIDANRALNPQGEPHIDFATYLFAASGKVNEDDMPRFYPSETTKYINAQLKQAGIPTMMYTNGYGYDIEMQDSDETVPPFEEMKAYAAKQSNHHYYQQLWDAKDGNNQVHITTARMCPTQQKWQDVLVNVHKKEIAPIGLSGVLLDQMSAANAVECFDPNHSHPLGGGHYWRDGYNTLLNRVRASYPEGTFLVTEGVSDDMINMVDGFELIHNYVYDGGVPAMSVLYGDKVAFIGISAGAKNSYDYNEMYTLKAYSYALGMTTGYFFMDFKENTNVVAYLRKLAMLKDKLETYISYGDMARKPEVTIQNNPTIHIARDGLEMDTHALQYAAWKSKDGKSVAFVFINGQEPSRQALNFSFSIDGATYGLHGNLKLKRVHANTEEDLQIAGDSQAVTLGAADAVAYILSESN